MIITEDIKKYLNNSVLCWLATVSKNGIPNVSPKELFLFYKENTIIIANVASPQSIKNIKANNAICLSFIDVLVQKGYQLKGTAKIIDHKSEAFQEMKKALVSLAGNMFPFNEIIEIHITSAKPIIAPSYLLFPETTEEDQIKNAIKQYKLS